MASRQRICIIDDDDAVRDSMKVMLESHGLCVSDFPSPREFLDEEGFEGCQCLVLDLHMPVMSGFDLLKTLRARRIAIPAVMVTARPDQGLATDADVFALLSKPVSDVELLDGIAAAIAASAH
jgi:FixJ family two-component response regulator